MKRERDVEKEYSLPEFVAKLRRLADALENNQPFDIQLAGERIFVPAHAIMSVEHEREGIEEEIEFQLRWENEEAAAADAEDEAEDGSDDDAEDRSDRAEPEAAVA
jgi:amphi-Trp domain-containing protein